MSDFPNHSLGQPTEYISHYCPDLICPIQRYENRRSLAIQGVIPFQGYDDWTAYEVSWLNRLGIPQARLASFRFDCHSSAMIESKSFKLYLNSYNQSCFFDDSEVIAHLKKDLSSACGADVDIQLLTLDAAANATTLKLPGHCIDHHRPEIHHYRPCPDLLQIEEDSTVEYRMVYSHLLKTNCPVTNQPDWASVWVEYRGKEIQQEALLAYIISFREHQDFHEHCVETIFCDILKQCALQQLTVYARYTRRGGLDINPLRTNFSPGESRLSGNQLRTARQ